MEALKPNASEMTKLGGEFLGSFLVVLVVCSNYSAGREDPGLIVFGPTSIACVYMAMSYILKSVSGGILNPAVTVSLVLQQELEKLEGAKIVIAQGLGGAAAGFATLFLYGWDSEANIVEPRSAGFIVGAPLVEMLYTCLLCFVYLNVNTAPKPKTSSFYGLACGFVFIAGGVGGRYVSGGAFNPAVSLGVNFMGTNWKAITLPIYLAAQTVGAILAVLLFQMIRKDQGTEDEELTRGFLTKGVQFVTEKIDPEDASEFLGSLFLTLTVSLNQIASQDSGNAGLTTGKVWSSAACYISLIYALGDCSGGLFNPAITVTYAVRFFNTGMGIDDDGRCSLINAEPNRLCDWKLSNKETIKYLMFQLLGGAAGTGLTILVWLASGTWPVAPITPGHASGGTQYSVWQAMFAEFYGSFLICYCMVVVMMSSKAVPEFGPFVIGGCTIAAGYAFGPLSGGIFNPAIVLANSVGSKFQALYTLPPLMYVLAQFGGGVVAGLVFRLFTHKEDMTMAPARESLLPVLP